MHNYIEYSNIYKNEPKPSFCMKRRLAYCMKRELCIQIFRIYNFAIKL